jgi:predicted aspartyl protease
LSTPHVEILRESFTKSATFGELFCFEPFQTTARHFFDSGKVCFMETHTMGRVLAEVTIENLKDRWAVEEGTLSPEQIRRITVTDALADTGATMLSLPTKLIRELGLSKTGSRRISTATGVGQADVYGTVWLTIHGRDCPLDVMEVPDGVPVLIGQIPLERLDFVVDPQGQRLIGNPRHNGEYIIDAY